MRIKDVEKQLGIKRTHIRYLQREGLFVPSTISDNNYRDFSEEDVRKLEVILLLMKSGVSAKEVKKLHQEEITLDDALNLAYINLCKKANEIQKAMERIGYLRANAAPYEALKGSGLWGDYQEETDANIFRGFISSRDTLSEYPELLISMERIIQCPYCGGNKRIDFSRYVTKTYTEERDMGFETQYTVRAEHLHCDDCGKHFSAKGVITEYPQGTLLPDSIDIIQKE